MSYKSVLIISDNGFIVKQLINMILKDKKLSSGRTFEFGYHPKNELFKNISASGFTIYPIDIKQDYPDIINKYDLVISAHCKQLFPKELVEGCRCINLHPGYNPHNRGWYPQVFSILNGLPLGATIHEIDAEIDHGSIIDQEELQIKNWDTSLSAYKRVQQLEIILLKRSLNAILDGRYETRRPEGEGNVNYKKDFSKLRRIDLEEKVTFEQAIKYLRALSHPPFRNAYFIDPETNRKIWVDISLEEAEETVE